MKSEQPKKVPWGGVDLDPAISLTRERELKRFLIIIDDNLDSIKSYNSELTLLCCKNRHYGIHLIITGQVFARIPTTIRRNADLTFLLYLTIDDSTFGEYFGKKKLKLFNQFFDDYVLKGKQYSFVCMYNNPSEFNSNNILYEDGKTRERMWIRM